CRTGPTRAAALFRGTVLKTVVLACLRNRRLRFRRRLPDLYGPVQAGRGDPLAVGAEGHALDPASVAAQDLGLRAGPVPDLDGAVGTAPGQPPVVPAERHALGRRSAGVAHVVEQFPGCS